MRGIIIPISKTEKLRTGRRSDMAKVRPQISGVDIGHFWISSTVSSTGPEPHTAPPGAHSHCSQFIDQETEAWGGSCVLSRRLTLPHVEPIPSPTQLASLWCHRGKTQALGRELDADKEMMS